MNYGTLHITTEYEHDGVVLSPLEFDSMARANADATLFEDFRQSVTARVKVWEVFTEKHGTRTFETFADFARFISIEKITYLFVYDGVETFSFLDACVNAAGFEYVERETQKDDETGRFKKFVGNGFCELSGELGQRYSFTLWTKQKRTRAEGGDRHERTHGTDFYAFKNFFNRGYAKTAAAFGVEGKPSAKGLFDIITAFDKTCRDLTGRAFLGAKKPRALTAGGLAKKELLRFVVGYDDDRANEKAYKQKHPITNAQDEYLRERKLNRGGINYANPRFLGKRLAGLKKYDVSSEYSAAASSSPDLLGVECCDVAELFKQKDGYIYIAIFDSFRATAKRGMPAIMTHPNTGENPRRLEIFTEQAFFWEEIEALKAFYNFGECSIKYALRVKTGKNSGNARFAATYYEIKETARNSGNYAFAEFAKLMLNSAWGKYSQRADFPVVRHVYNNQTGLFEIFYLKGKNAPKLSETNPNGRAGGLSILQGAYITMRGRLIDMKYILQICGERKALNTFVYTDTDSILTFENAPAEIVKPSVMGLLKDESNGGYVDAKILEKKVYYCVRSAAPLDADLHARGIPLSSVVDELLKNYGAEDFGELPADALADAFAEGIAYDVPLLSPVHGGRAVLYMRKSILGEQNSKLTDGRRFVGDENGRLIEI